MVYTVPIPVVIAISPFIFGGIVLGTITWTFAYVRRVRERAATRARALAEKATKPIDDKAR